MAQGTIQRSGIQARQLQDLSNHAADPAHAQTEGLQKGIGTAKDLGGPLQIGGDVGNATPANLTPPQDTFSAAPALPKPADNPIDPAQTAALEKFQNRLVDILGVGTVPTLTAGQLAPGQPPAVGQTGGEITPEQQKQLAQAGKDLLMEMPIAALSPSAAAYAKSYLETRGVDTQGFESKNIKDLKPYASELAENLVRDMKSNSPAAFYGLAAAGAVAVGAYGYQKGSDALKKLGIKPEVDTKLFNDQVRARAEASWGEKLKDPNLTLGADGKFRISPTSHLRVGASATVGGPSVSQMGIKSAEANLAYEGEQNSASATARFAANGQLESATAKLATDRKFGAAGHDHLTASTQARFSARGFSGIDGEAKYERSGALRVSAQGTFSTDEKLNITKGNAEARLTGDRGTVGFKMNYDRPSDAFGYALDAKYRTEAGLTLQGNANFDRRFEMERGRLGVSQSLQGVGLERFSVEMNSTFGRAGRFEGIGAEAKYRNDAWRLSAGVQHNAITDRTTGSLSVGYEARKNLDFQVRGSLDTQGQSQIGAGLRWRF